MSEQGENLGTRLHKFCLFSCVLCKYSWVYTACTALQTQQCISLRNRQQNNVWFLPGTVKDCYTRPFSQEPRIWHRTRGYEESFTWFMKRHKKCIPGLLGGRGHWCMAIDDVETSHGFLHAFVVCSTVVWLGSSLILSYWSSCYSDLHSPAVQWWV